MKHTHWISLLLVLVLLLGALPMAAASATELTPLASYDFTEIKDGVVPDVSGNGRDAVVHDSVRVEEGLAVFGGGYLQLPDDLMVGLDAMTVVGWINYSDAKAGTKEIYDNRFFDFGSGTNNYFNFGPNTAWGVQLAEVKVNGTLHTAQYGTKSGSPFTRFSFPSPGTWTHVAVSFGEGAVKVYLNGKEVASGATTFAPKDLGSTNQNYIGKSQWPDPNFLGQMENLEIYGSVLTAQQVQSHRMDTGDIVIADPAEHLIAAYDFSQETGDVVPDVSGHGNHAEIHGAVSAVGGLGQFSGGYLQLPNNINSGLDAMTVSGWLNVSDEKVGTQEIFNTRFFDFGSSTSNYFNFGPNNAWGQQVAEIKVNNSLVDAKKNAASASPWTSFTFPAPGTWAHVAVTLGDGAMRVYLDGVEIAHAATAFTPKDVGATGQNYLGKSQYADPLFLGQMENVEIYSTALSGVQILSRMNAQSQRDNHETVDRLAAALASIDLGDLTAVSTSLTLPERLEDVTFTWSSDAPELLGHDGAVSPDLKGTYTVTLTVTASLNGVSAEKDYAVTLVGLTDAQIVAYDKANLGLATLVESDKLTLPTVGKKGSVITWATSDPGLIEADGTVHRPASGSGNDRVTLTATITCGDASDTKVFADRLVMEEYTMYLLTYFGGEELKTDHEPTYATVHFALSRDGLHWTPLNGNKTIVAATIKGQDNPAYGQDRPNVSLARDPVVYREQDGSFRLLSSHSWNNFDIYVWDKGDLTSFTGERILKVRGSGNAWAPEVVYDAVKEMNLIISTDPNNGENCGWGCYTTDFTQADIEEIGQWDIPMMYNTKNGRGYIDCSVYQYDGKYYMTYSSQYSPPRIWISGADSLEADAFTPIGQVTLDSNPFAEGPFIIKDHTMERWYCYYDYPLNGGIFGCSYTDDLDSGIWTQLETTAYSMPYGVRHGNAISITEGEAQKLIDAYGIDLSITEMELPDAMKVDVGTPVTEMELPETLQAMLSDGSRMEFPVSWDTSDYDPDGGRCTVTGAVTIADENIVNADQYRTVSVTVKVGEASAVVAKYVFSETEEGKIADVSGNGNDAVVVGNVTADGRGNFQGGYLRLPDGIVQGMEEVTVSGWMNFSQAQYDTRFFDFGNNTSNYFNFGPNSAWGYQVSEVKVAGSLVDAIYGAKTEKPFTSFTFPAPGTWTHVAVTLGQGSMKLYLNGVLAAESATGFTAADLGVTTANYLGASQFEADPNFLGQMDEVMIYDEVLTQDAVKNLMEETDPERITEVTLTLSGQDAVRVDMDSVVYTVGAENMVGLATVLIKLELDDAYLTEPVVETVGEDWYLINQTYKNGVLYVAVGNNKGAWGSGELFTVTARPTGATGTLSAAITRADLSAFVGEDSETLVDAVLGDPVVTELLRNPYDVNRDGVVNQLDMTRAQRYYGGSNADADVNDDGTVDMNDLILILNNFHEAFEANTTA